MIKDTNSKIQRPLKASQRVENSGFIRLIVIFVILIGIMVYFKIDPQEVWDKIIKPVLNWGLDTIGKTIDFIFKIAMWLVNTFRDIYKVKY